METIKINSAPTTEPAAPPTNNPVAPTALAEIQMAEPSEPDLDSPSAQENPNAQKIQNKSHSHWKNT